MIYDINKLYVLQITIFYRKITLIQQLEETKATNERTITKQNELIKTKGYEVEVLKNQNNLIIAQSKVDAKQRELEHDKQKLQQELNQKKEESQKQMQHSAENAKVQSEIKELHGERFVFKKISKELCTYTLQ